MFLKSSEAFRLSLKLLLKFLFKQLQLILNQFIIMHAKPEQCNFIPILGRTQFTQNILDVLCEMNLSAANFFR